MPRENESFIQHEIKEITFFIIFGLVMAVVLPIFLGFVLGAFEGSFISGRPLQFGDILVTYLIYYIIILGGLIGLPVLKIREMYLTERGEHVAKQSNPSPFSVAYLHDPEIDGGLYSLFRYLGFKGDKNPMRFSISMLRMFVIGALIFGMVGILQTAFPQSQVVGIPQLPFQVTETVEVLFTAEPPAFAETTLMIFILSLLMGFNAYFVSKTRLPPAMFWFIGFVIICPIVGLGWMGFHNIVYGNSEAKLLATFVFGFVGSIITIAFGTWIWWYEWHFFNNVFAKLREVVPANEDIIFISLLIWFSLLILWIGTEIVLRRIKKKSSYKVAVPD